MTYGGRYGHIALGLLFVLALYSLSPYTVPIFLGAVLCTVGWRTQIRLETSFRLPRVVGATLHALAWLGIIVLPTWLVIETLISNLGPVIAQWRSGGTLVTIPPELAHIPIVGRWLAEHLHAPSTKVLLQYLGNHSDLVRTGLAHAWIFILHTTVASLVVFSLALRGEKVAAEVDWIAQSLWGPRGLQIVSLAARSAKAVMIGIIGVGLVEGVLIGVAYAIAGMPMWPSWLIATVALSAIPFGAGAILAIVCGWLMLTGHFLAGLLTAIWGGSIITLADLVLRPLVTGTKSSVPFMVLLLSILGGAKVFGLVGVIAGPILVMLATSLWQSWLRETNELSAPTPPPTA
ncbi:MAG TPA: AI-2E family transporter [Acidiferrobacter sp.]|nr:AI-2E family transporter [Acidiferrobacter sp.]